MTLVLAFGVQGIADEADTLSANLIRHFQEKTIEEISFEITFSISQRDLTDIENENGSLLQMVD